MGEATPTSTLRSKLESILFAAGKPLSLKKLADLLSVGVGEVEAAARELQEYYTERGHGLEIILHQGEALMATRPEHSDLVREFLKAEELGDLTRPQLEALSVLAYRGPLSKPELEQVRGVNCSLILRNLMIRGLVEATDEAAALPRYQVTVDFLRYLGLTNVAELPEYSSLAADTNLGQAIAGTAVLSEPTPTDQG